MVSFMAMRPLAHLLLAARARVRQGWPGHGAIAGKGGQRRRTLPASAFFVDHPA